MALLTIFSTPKPFTDAHIATIQRNAIQSWCNLGPQVEVLLVGEEDGQTQVAHEYGIRNLSAVRRNASGTPLVSSIFELAREASDSPYLAYVNADILVMPDIVQAIKDISRSFDRAHDRQTPFLLIGQRWDLDVRDLLDFRPGWDARLQAEAKKRGQLHRPAGSDYFLYPRQAAGKTMFGEMPDFAIGRAGWDNWMIYHVLHQGWSVIDGTPSVMIVHQDHDYSHLPDGKPHYDQQESYENMALAGGIKHMYMVLDAPQQLVNGEVRRAPNSLIRNVRAIERALTPNSGGFRGLRGALARRFRRWRRRLG